MYETPLDLLREIVQETHRFDSKDVQEQEFARRAQEYPEFVEAGLTLYARLHRRDVCAPKTPRPNAEQEAAMSRKEIEEKQRRLDLALASRVLGTTLSNGLSMRECTGPQLRREGKSYGRIAAMIPRGKRLADVSVTDEQRLKIAAAFR